MAVQKPSLLKIIYSGLVKKHKIAIMEKKLENLSLKIEVILIK